MDTGFPQSTDWELPEAPERCFCHTMLVKAHKASLDSSRETTPGHEYHEARFIEDFKRHPLFQPKTLLETV